MAIDVTAHRGTVPPGTPAGMLDTDAQRRSRIEAETPAADFLIHPDLGYLASPGASYFRQPQMAGEATARQLLPELMARMRKMLLPSTVAAGVPAGEMNTVLICLPREVSTVRTGAAPPASNPAPGQPAQKTC
jgi:hypothetical protein